MLPEAKNSTAEEDKTNILFKDNKNIKINIIGYLKKGKLKRWLLADSKNRVFNINSTFENSFDSFSDPME